MPNSLKVQNFYYTNITSESIPSSGAFTFNVAIAPTYTNGFLVISAENVLQREIVYFHAVAGNVLSVRSENRGIGGTTAKEHVQGESITMRDVAEIFNFYSDTISTCFFTEKVGGLNVKVWGGGVYYNAALTAVADTNLTLTDNTINYIKYTYTTNVISVDTVNSGNVKVIVTVVSGVIVSIVYQTAKETYTDFTVSLNTALPTQTGNAGKGLVTDGTNANWQTIIPSQSSNSGKALSTNGSNVLWTNTLSLSVIKGTIQSDIDAATIVFDKSLNDFHSVTLGGNRTLALSNISIGDRIVVNLIQDATGSRTVSWFTTIKWQGGIIPILTPTATKGDLFAFWCISTNVYYGMIIGQNF